MRLVSWTHTRLPDQIWTALLVTRLDRDFALEILRTVAKACQGFFEKGSDLDITLTGLARMKADVAETILDIVFSAPGARDVLEPLLLFSDLPGRERWVPHLSQGVGLDAWNDLARTVGLVLHHQSQEATDCRWARVLFRVASGQMHLPSREQFMWLANYPKEGDQRQVRPMIRATEIAENPLHDYSDRDRWAESFWQQCLKRTPCGNFLRPSLRLPGAETNRTHVLGVLAQVARSARDATRTTAADARHASAFGLTAYTLNILIELLGMGIAQSVLGRLGLRAVLEAYITLRYLATIDKPSSWEAYRAYGQGQAKLAMLKADEFEEAPGFVTPDLLEQFASEDKGPEFLSINVGHWANADLRKLSNLAGAKDAYDRIYPWTSAFVHANWAGVRAATMVTCGNPLHRLHSVTQPTGNVLDDVIADVCDLVDDMLLILGKLYEVDFPSVVLPGGT